MDGGALCPPASSPGVLGLAPQGAALVGIPKEWGVFLPPTMALGEYLAPGEGNRCCGWGAPCSWGGDSLFLGKGIGGIPVLWGRTSAP